MKTTSHFTHFFTNSPIQEVNDRLNQALELAKSEVISSEFASVQKSMEVQTQVRQDFYQEALEMISGLTDIQQVEWKMAIFSDAKHEKVSMLKPLCEQTINGVHTEEAFIAAATSSELIRCIRWLDQEINSPLTCI